MDKKETLNDVLDNIQLKSMKSQELIDLAKKIQQFQNSISDTLNNEFPNFVSYTQEYENVKNQMLSLVGKCYQYPKSAEFSFLKGNDYYQITKVFEPEEPTHENGVVRKHLKVYLTYVADYRPSIGPMEYDVAWLYTSEEKRKASMESKIDYFTKFLIPISEEEYKKVFEDTVNKLRYSW